MSLLSLPRSKQVSALGALLSVQTPQPISRHVQCSLLLLLQTLLILFLPYVWTMGEKLTPELAKETAAHLL